MTTELTHEQYIQRRMARCMRDTVDAETASAIQVCFARFVLHSLSGSEVRLMSYLLGITAGERKHAEECSTRDLEDGGRDKYLGLGTGLSRSAVKVAVKSLMDRGLLTVFRRVEIGSTESLPRLFEPNFQAILNAQVGQNLTRGGQNLTTPSLVSKDTHVENHGELKFSFPAGAGLTTEGKVDMGFVGKKPAAKKERPTYSSASDAIASIQKESRGRVAARVESAERKAVASNLSVPELQALFDKHMKEAGHAHRCMVTKYGYGVLKKRLKENAPVNMSDFIRYCCIYWTVLAQQNKVSTRKDKDRLVAGKTLPSAPDFKTFAFWYPYFFRCYLNHLAGKTIAQRDQEIEDATKRQVAELSKELAEAKRNVAILRRSRTAKPEPVKPATPARSRKTLPARTTDVDLLADTQFPEWK